MRTPIYSRFAPILVGLALALTAQTVHAQELSTTETHPNRAMLSSGVVALGGPYLASLIVAAASNHPGDHNLYVPVAGPWIDLGNRSCPFGTSCRNEGLYKGLLIMDGIFQGIGALDIVGAFLFPETVTYRTASTGRTASKEREQHRFSLADIRVLPTTVDGGGAGLVALGKF